MGALSNTVGKNTPFTEIKAEPNVILEIKDKKVLLGFGRKKRTRKTEKALSQVAGFSPRKIKEFEFKDSQNLKAGGKITVSVFEPGDLVKVTGITKGRGFAGGVKRWGFSGGPKTHGQSDRHRAIGSIGAGTTPGRVYKGKKMPGHMGVANQTVINLEVIDVDEKNNMLLVKGAIPGPRNGLVIVKKTGKVKNFVPYKGEIKIEAPQVENIDEGQVEEGQDKAETKPAEEAGNKAVKDKSDKEVKEEQNAENDS